MEMLNEMTFLFMLMIFVIISKRRLRRNRWGESSYRRHHIRQLNYHRLIHESDLACLESTRMNRRTFAILCNYLRTIGNLRGTKNMDVEELVAIFLHILAHDQKNRIMKRLFARSGETISRQFNIVLKAVLRLHEVLLKRPEPFQEIPRTKDGNGLRTVWEHLMEHTSRSMCLQRTRLSTVLERVKLLPTCWEYALKICNLYMYCPDGRVPQLTQEFYEMLYLGGMG